MGRFDVAEIAPSRELRFVSPDGTSARGTGGPHRLGVPVSIDLQGKWLAMEEIRNRPFVADANEIEFIVAQRWIEECGREVSLPLNFCGGLLIMRLYRLITPESQQTTRVMAAVYEAAAAYDFAFLALAHADDEADQTFVRHGEPTRFVTNPDTRAVDGINLLLTGVTAMHDTLNRWPNRICDDEEAASEQHPLAMEIVGALMRALREASFPILLDRAGLGHELGDGPTSSGLAPILIDGSSLKRVEAFARHRAHTYFMRATDLAALLAGYSSIATDLSAALDELFGFWGLLGAATDDLQDLFIDFAAGIHSTCTVIAHLCVAEDVALRPAFRRDLPESLVADQRRRLADFVGATDSKLDRSGLLALLNEIELRRALTEHFESQGMQFAGAIYKAASNFGFSTELMIEIVSVVCGDPDFTVPEIYHVALKTVTDESLLQTINVQVGIFVAGYIVNRFWPTSPT
jgi:hypothetical protein